MTKSITRLFGALMSALVSALPAIASDLPIVRDGRSDYVIYYDPSTAAEHKGPAGELMLLIKAATGVNLRLVTQPAEPMICIGDNAAARAAGFSSESLPEEGFRIVTAGKNLYILGKDQPKGAAHSTGGTSTGTLFGVFTFAERVLDARFLLPGPDGDDIPHRDELLVLEMDLTESPDFAHRTINHVHDGSGAVQRWKTRMKLGTSIKIDHGHAWDAYPSHDVLRANPEYMAKVGGFWSKPEKSKYNMYNYKFCTLNPGLIGAFADAVNADFDKNPARYSISLSPTDGAGWCEMPECRAMEVPGPHPVWGDYGGYGYSRTPQVLRFYNDVAKLIAKKHPDKMLGGYVYADYTYPPDGDVKLEPNVFAVLAARPYYGMTLYKPQYQEQFRKLIDAWSRITPNLGYYDLDTWMRNFTGAPIGPSKSILKFVFPILKEKNVKLVCYTGLEAYGYAGIHNYLVAKLMWDADADVDALYRDYLERAYGPGADAMNRLYTLLDQEMEANELKSNNFNYEMTSEILLAIYVKQFDTIEALYKEALSKVATDAQRKRLEMFGDNLVCLHAILRRGDVLANAEASIFYKSDEDYTTFRQEKKGALSMVYAPSEDYGQKYGGLTKLFIAERRELKVPPLASNAAVPAIDGDLADAAWQGAVVAGEFRLPGTSNKASAVTDARVLYDAQNLYVAIRCDEPGATPLRQACTTRDDITIYSDDIAELFLAPTDDYQNHFWHLTVNPANTQWDALVNNAKYNLEWTSAVKQSDKGWTVEIAIPFKSLGLDGAPVGKTWRVNLARQDEPRHETSSWNKVEAGNLESRNFGAWTFDAAPAAAEVRP